MAIKDPSIIPLEQVTVKRAFTAEEKRRMVQAPGNAAAHRIVFWRRFTQLATFGLFVLFFFMTTVNSQTVGWVPKNLFMSLDFLNTLKNGIASHHVAIAALGPGLAILLLTLWGGRIFCGWICPLGTLIDISDRLLYRKGRLFANRKRSDTRRFRNWKYLYLLAGLGAIVYGVDILTFGDPLSLITRTFTFCFYGPIAYVWNGVLNVADQLGLSRAAYRAFGWEISAWHLPKMIYYNAMPVLLMFIGVIALSMYQERFWCRNLCPYGGLLALISRVGWLRHYVKMDGCIHCMKCEVQSRMGCYDNLEKGAKEPVKHAIEECIQCFRCETICPPDVIQIEAKVPLGLLGVPALRRSGGIHRDRVPAERVMDEQDGAGPDQHRYPGHPGNPVHPVNAGTPERPAAAPPVDVGRRRVLAALGAGLFWGATAKSSASNYQGKMRRYPKNNKAMRPPGALAEEEFLSACTRCAECMKVCPTNALQPAMLETGLEGIWTPLLVPSIGPCAEKCTACGDVCPTGAIRPFSWQDKRYKIKMGLANVDQSTCIAWNGGRDCVVCAEVCPYSAVVFRDKWDDGLAKDPSRPITDPGNKGRLKRVPTVDEKLCTGCGICEFQCPVLPDHAIVVYSFQEDRDYHPPAETPIDGFLRRNWEKHKEQGKDAEYAHTKQEFEARAAIQGPGATQPGSGQ